MNFETLINAILQMFQGQRGGGEYLINPNDPFGRRYESGYNGPLGQGAFIQNGLLYDPNPGTGITQLITAPWSQGQSNQGTAFTPSLLSQVLESAGTAKPQPRATRPNPWANWQTLPKRNPWQI